MQYLYMDTNEKYFEQTSPETRGFQVTLNENFGLKPQALPGDTCSPACRARRRERDLTGSLAIRPLPLPYYSKTPAEPPRPRIWGSRRCCPRFQKPKASAGRRI